MSRPRYCVVCLERMPDGYVERHDSLEDCVHAMALAKDEADDYRREQQERS